MTSFYSWRLYWLLKQYEDFGKRRMSLTEFAEKMMIEKKYQEWYDIKRRVLQPVQKDLRKSDMRFEYEVEKQGRKVAFLTFTFGGKVAGKQQKDEKAKRIPKKAGKAKSDPLQGELNFEDGRTKLQQNHSGLDHLSKKLMNLGLTQQEVQYYKDQIKPQQLNKIAYAMDVKYTGSSIAREQLRHIAKESLEEFITVSH